MCAEDSELMVLPPDSPTSDGANPGARTLGEALGRKKAKDPMQELLHWGIENSDPERLKDVMQKYKDSNLTLKDVYGQDFVDALFVDEAGVMKKAAAKISDFQNASLTDDELERALYDLQEMVEQIDNAGNLHNMGGLSPLLELATGGGARSSSIQALALWTLGVAVQNNEPVQEDLVSLQGIERLVARLPLCGGGGALKEEEVAPEYCGKLIFAIGGLVRNSAKLQADASELGLFDWLMDAGTHQSSAAVVKKVLGLLDTVLAQSPDLPFLDNLPARKDSLEAALLTLARGFTVSAKGDGGDVDLSEKALRVVNRLLSLRPMLFGDAFRPALLGAARSAVEQCEHDRGAGDEVCEGLSGLLGHADLALAARDVTDEEL